MITETGLTIKRYEEIVAELEADLRGYFGDDLDLSDDSLFGIINKVYANAQAEQWEMANAVYNAFNIDVATGKQLDDLVALIGLTRLPEANTTGLVEFTGIEGTNIPASTLLKTSTTNLSILTDTASSISSAACYSLQVTLPSILTGTIYSVNVNGKTYSYTASGSDTADIVMAKLVDEINFDITATWSANVIVGQGYFTIISNSVGEPLTVLVGTGMGFGEVTSAIQATTTESGEIVVLEGTVTVLGSPITGVASVTNTLPFDTGRLQETDDELRLRQSVSTSIIGSSSRGAIEARLRNVEGVTFAKVLENTSMFTDENGLPAKSFEAIVEGSTDKNVATAIYNIKPAGIATYGNRVTTVEDEPILFTRPLSVIYYVKVVYSLYDEEVFPTNGADLIRQAVLEHSSTIDLGEDIINQRFFGEIFSTVQGIQSLDIKLGYAPLETTETVLPIGETSRGLLFEDNIEVTLGS